MPLPKDTETALDDVEAGKPQTLLILGSDQRYIDKEQGNPARSDTIILLRLDPARGATAVMSIPRDLKVDIPTKNGPVTDKINAAYSIGGPALTVKTIKQLTGLQINHVVNINFGGFKDAVDRLGCVYVDVDRRYYNDNNPPNGSDSDYATINVKPGYQKLCGQKALDYVRYRHFDTDLVRAARQQDFLRQAKEQVGRLQAAGRPRGAAAHLRAQHADRHPRHPGDPAAAEARLRVGPEPRAGGPLPLRDRRELRRGDARGPAHVGRRVPAGQGLRGRPRHPAAARGRRGDQEAHRAQAQAAGLPGHVREPDAGRGPGHPGRGRAVEDQEGGQRAPLPVYYPTLAAVGSAYVSDAASPRAYAIRDRGGHKYKAYRLVVEAQGLGQYYGVQGTDWKAPPILDNPSETRKIHGRTLELFYDGDRLRLVAWRTSKGAYWVSNTLLQTLSERQMLGIAQSLKRVGT